MSDPTRTHPPTDQPNKSQHPLGPLVYRLPAKRPGLARWQAGCVLFVSISLLSVASWLKPDPSGLGSHRQLGLPGCTLIILTGYPCPTCGMTTAYAHTVRGQLLDAFYAHPGGLALALLTILFGFIAVDVLLFGRVWSINWYRISPAKVALIAVFLLIFGWGFKIVMGITTGRYPL